MPLIRGLSHLESFKNGCVLTIDNFDGLHLGHQIVKNDAIVQVEKYLKYLYDVYQHTPRVKLLCVPILS
jgi:FAD synthase